MFEFDREGNMVWELKGKHILKGETDGSSYQNGGLRATHRAGGYLTIDPTSPIFIRDDTVFIPACLISYEGYALDEKTPLHRSCDALTKEGKRLLNLLGFGVEKLNCDVGLEQEFFLVPREHYKSRIDLQLTGRTVVGKDAPRGQEMCDHYMAPPNVEGRAYACMKEIQDECYKLGIPLKTRHREVAPGQFEFAPTFGVATTQVDQNLMVMQIMDEIAPKHGLACLAHEKPFSGINGSGKHNNWNIGTSCGTNLFNYEQVEKRTGNSDIFPLIMAAVVKAIDNHGDLMRLSIAAPGNEFRLGACEAPPAIMSVYLGEAMTTYLDSYRKGSDAAYAPQTKTVNLGASTLPELQIPNEDRNRTSPFPYGNGRFEFRAVGSSQNVSLVNTVLNTILADTFKDFADKIEGGMSAKEVTREALEGHWKVIFNGDNYDLDNQAELTAKGLWRIDSSVDAIKRYTAPKNKDLFSRMGVLAPEECEARENVLLLHYVGTVEIEVKCMIDMMNQHIIPSIRNAQVDNDLLDKLIQGVGKLQAAWNDIHQNSDLDSQAHMARVLRLETMEEVRAICDEAEGICPANLWTLSTYNDLLFLDQA
jgi:glutamine synthetase